MSQRVQRYRAWVLVLLAWVLTSTTRAQEEPKTPSSAPAVPSRVAAPPAEAQATPPVATPAASTAAPASPPASSAPPAAVPQPATPRRRTPSPAPAATAPLPAQRRESDTATSTGPTSAPATGDKLQALQVEAEHLRTAGDAASLQLLCDSRRAQQDLEDRALYLTWQSLCRGWSALTRHEVVAARTACAAVVPLAASVTAPWRSEARGLVLESHFCVGEAHEQDYRSDDTCLARLGDQQRARSEAEHNAALRAMAEDAYREVLQLDQGVDGLRAMLRMVGMSDFFYRRVTSAPNSLRGMSLGPPTRELDLSRSPLLEAYLAPEESALRRKVLLAYRKLLRRAKDRHAPAELVQEIETALTAFEAFRPAVTTSLRAPWPERRGQNFGVTGIASTAPGYVLSLESGGEQSLTRDQVVPRMRELLAPMAASVWAPRAARELADLADLESRALLIEALASSKDPELQVSAAYALGRIGSEEAVEPLLKALAEAHTQDPRPLFDTPSHAAFGLPERILEALISIGQRIPQSLEGLLGQPELPPQEAAYVLWACRAKGLYNTYARMREHRDPVVTAYGVMALVDLQGESVRWVLADAATDDATLRCVRKHLRIALDH
ncbi:MAG: HEAT repeat domain-containing protein [Pseudomonadota bacterium]